MEVNYDVTIIISAIISAISAIVVALIGYRSKQMLVKIDEDDTVKLSNHIVHRRLLSYKRRIESNFQVYQKDDLSKINPGKTLLFKHIFITQINIWSIHLFELSDYIDNADDQYNIDLYEKNIEIFNKSIHEINTFMYNSDYTEEEKELLQIVNTKLSIKNENRMRFLEERIEGITNNRHFYPTPLTQQIAIFDLYISIFADISNDFYEMVKNINGQLSKYNFRGHKITD